jgi:gentisate 1,2-dioxygenase
MTDTNLQAFYREIGAAHMAPLWENLHALVPRSPVSPIRPAFWDYKDTIRPHLMRAGELVSAEKAERRVLILENPGSPGSSAITQTLYAGAQLLCPGERAPSHRHTQSALRLVIEGDGAYTSVEGERIIMKPGDFIITPGWRFHDHGNETAHPIVWLDGLDIPLVGLLGAGFAESGRDRPAEAARASGDSLARFGRNMVPADWAPRDRHSPVLSYPYEKSLETLRWMRRSDPVDDCHGHKLRFVNPATGGYPLATIAAFIQLLPEGATTIPYRSTDATVYCVVEGCGESRIGDSTFSWKPHDVMVVPSWTPYSHRAFTAEATLFSFSDRPVQESLGLWREQRG